MNFSFIKGLQLSEIFYHQFIAPILAAEYPRLPYAAALLGPGSDALGFDTPHSMDHDWGPRLMLFLPEAGFAEMEPALQQLLVNRLPLFVAGYPIDMAYVNGDALDGRTDPPDPHHHSVQILTVGSYFRQQLGADPFSEWTPAQWLAWPQQILRSLTSGKLFHDGVGELTAVRQKLHYYPRDIWLYLMAAQWRRIDQEEPFMGRCGQAGDELGSRLVAGRLVRDIMRLCFLQEQCYAPYIKWFGTAFQQLSCAVELTPRLTAVLQADSWQDREKELTAVYQYVAHRHNALAVTEPLTPELSSFHQRPFQVIHSGRFVDAIRRVITDTAVLALPEHLGGIDQFVDSTDVLSYPAVSTHFLVTSNQ
jgi:hypothetical protein